MNIIDSNISFKSNMSYGNSPNAIVLHHAEASSCTVNDIDRWHKERGWAGIGYHFFVRKDGTVYRGRPENAIGAHCQVKNTNTLGICAEGAYMTETMPEIQKQTIVELCKYLKAKYPAINSIYGHKELMPTSCPGDNYPLSEIKNLINSGEASNAAPVNPTPIVNNSSPRDYLQVGDTGDKVKTLQQSLIKFGFSCGSAGADGIYGKDTKNAVYNFQKSIKITTDGLAGNETFDAINQILKVPTDGIKYPHYEYATRFIQYKVGAPVNGLFDTLCSTYVKDYQREKGLVVDGVVGPKTWGTLL